MPEPVVSHRVVTGILAEREENRRTQDDPAERVTRLAPGQHEAHHREGSRDPDRQRAAAGVQALAREARQGDIGDYQCQHQAAEDQRGRR